MALNFFLDIGLYETMEAFNYIAVSISIAGSIIIIVGFLIIIFNLWD